MNNVRRPMKRVVALGAALGLVAVACTGGAERPALPPPATVAQVTAPATGGLADHLPLSIQALVDAAGPGDVIEVPIGQYEGGFEVVVEQLTIRSEDPLSGGGHDVSSRYNVELETVVYGSAAVGSPQPGMKDLLADVYRPVGTDDAEPRAALLAIHGGGFAAGSRDNERIAGLCADLASRGQVCVSIDYRLRDDEPPTAGINAGLRAISAAVEDAESALAWLHANREDLGIDPARVTIGGMSAGAITALAVAYESDTGLPINGVVDLWGGLYDRVGVIDAGEPPVMIVHGTDDRVVPFGLTTDIVERASAVGVPFAVYPVVGAGHSVDLGRTVGGVSFTERIAAFVGR